MSYAIFELDIRQPPASLHRRDGFWYLLCERCDKRSPLTALISEALLIHENHADVHVDDDEAAVQQWLSTSRNPLVVTALKAPWRDVA